MVCDHCKERDAVVQLTQIVGSTVTQLRLCERCAAEKGIETTVAMPKHPLGDLLQTVQQQMPVGRADATACGFCGMTMKDFRTTGRLGCARCYREFEASLRELLRRVQGSSRHVGRRYDPPHPEAFEKQAELASLREELRRAIQDEQFERAANLRDQIKVLE